MKYFYNYMLVFNPEKIKNKVDCLIQIYLLLYFILDYKQ